MISEEAPTCPKCGAPAPVRPAASRATIPSRGKAAKQARRAERAADLQRLKREDPAAYRKQMITGGSILGGIVLIVALIGIFGGSSDSGGEGGGGGTTGGDKVDSEGNVNTTAAFGAQVACEDFVKDRLRSPSTAHFSGRSRHHLPTGEYVSAGDVDSENGFGAKIRSTFSCTVTDAGTKWLLQSLTIDGEPVS